MHGENMKLTAKDLRKAGSLLDKYEKRNFNFKVYFTSTISESNRCVTKIPMQYAVAFTPPCNAVSRAKL